MRFPKERVVDYFHARGQQVMAHRAETVLPAEVDTDRDAESLDRLGLVAPQPSDSGQADRRGSSRGVP